MSLGPNLGGVVLIAALTSCVRVVFNGAQHTKFDMFPNIDKIDKLVVPVFCVHGMADHVVPFNHGVELSHRARFPLEPLWIKGAGHNNLESTRFQFQVFLRYMHVLQELRRWMPPNDLEYNRVAPTSRRRDSFGALVKVASCFGPRGPSGKKTPSPQKTRKRVHRMVGTSSAQLLVPSLTKKDEVDLSVLWSADDDALVRRSMEMERRADRKSLPIARKGSFATRATSVVS